MVPPAANGELIAMVAWGKHLAGSDDAAVFTGMGDRDGKLLTMRREPGSVSFVIPQEWVARLKWVQPKWKATLLDADLTFSVSVGDIAGDDEASSLVQAGLKWPGDGRRS